MILLRRVSSLPPTLSFLKTLQNEKKKFSHEMTSFLGALLPVVFSRKNVKIIIFIDMMNKISNYFITYSCNTYLKIGKIFWRMQARRKVAAISPSSFTFVMSFWQNQHSQFHYVEVWHEICKFVEFWAPVVFGIFCDR